MAPFHDLGRCTSSRFRDTGYTDHVSFDAVGLPAFHSSRIRLITGHGAHHSDLECAMTILFYKFPEI